jgi:hypothetical protein
LNNCLSSLLKQGKEPRFHPATVVAMPAKAVPIIDLLFLTIKKKNKDNRTYKSIITIPVAPMTHVNLSVLAGHVNNPK